MIYASPLPDVEIPELPLTAYVLAGAAVRPDKPALIDGPSGRTLSYADLDTAVRSLAGGLAAAGFAKGDVLALMAPNTPEYAIVFHAVAMAGGIITTIKPTYTEAEVRSQLQDCGARLLVTIPPLVELASRACAGTQVAEVYLLGEAPGAKPLAGLFGPPLAEQAPVGPDDVVAYEFLVFDFATSAFLGTEHLLRPDIYQHGTPPCPQQPGGQYLYNPRNDLWFCNRLGVDPSS